MDKDDLLKLIEDDDLGLLNVKPKQSAVATADERLIASFTQINQFVSENGREPQSQTFLSTQWYVQALQESVIHFRPII